MTVTREGETMIGEIDWLELWRELARRAGRHGQRCWAPAPGEDAWADRALRYLEVVARRWEKPDSSRTTVLQSLSAESSVLDIGAGAGAWAALLARHVRHVTAVEPSPAMREVMTRYLADQGIDNVRIVAGAWPDVDVEEHDVSLCAHAMYGWSDLATGIRRMEAATRARCFLLLRVPTPDGVMAQASRLVRGQPHDSPNFVVAYNALLQMGIAADVVMEDTGLWGAWSHDTLDEALTELKDRLGIPDRDAHDGELRVLLQQQLEERDGRLVWPPGVRSALVAWDPSAQGRTR